MNFKLSVEEEAFRQEVEDFLDEELTDDVAGSIFIDTPERREFVSKMADRGWLSMGFPEEYGGTQKPMAMAQYILNQELEKASAPIVGKNVGVIANTILHNGSEEMKREFLPKIFRNEAQWAIVYSEPDAGTDLASLQCRAVLDGDEFVINGQKRFITSAHFADYFWTAVRTDPDAPKHRGISLLIIDKESPGITITPMYCVGSAGAERTNEVFFDDVRVPKDRLVGELNRGWYYMMEALDYERFAIISFTPTIKRFEKLVAWVKQAQINGRPLKDDPVVRRKIAHMAVLVEIGRMLELRCICAAAKTVPNIEASMNKAWGGIVWSEMTDLALDIMGPRGYIWQGSERAALGGEVVDQYLMAGHSRVAAAGVDIAKGIIARRLLGLPNA
jgi:alkylation response protein AidB-like acyl-CoA dehydrogenase